VKLRIRKIGGIILTQVDKTGYGQMFVNVEMTEAQMLDAILEFLTEVPRETRGKWLEIIEEKTT
jgi:hypothetical protein